MELKHIALDQLHLSPVNMRHGRKAPDISDILPSVRARGILQPLLVRPNAEGFEVVAGRRRFYCAKAVQKEQGDFPPVPCGVMDENDDASALEASLIENVARLDADEMTQYETLARLISREGRTVEGIAVTFGLSETQVRQRLALGNLLPKIREAYRSENIDAESIRYLTMAGKARQKEWLALFENDDGNCPFGHRLKQWLFGGSAISTKAALFPLDTYQGEIVTDLFGEESYFGDAEQFWTLQRQAIEAKREALLAEKWPDVIVLAPGEHFDQWAFDKAGKRKGGKVFITVAHRGDVEIFAGWLSKKEARKAKGKEQAEGPAKTTERPAMTQAMENYFELHRHAAVRLSLLSSPDTALRLLVAHALSPSGNWSVRADAQRSLSPAIRASIEGSEAQKLFDAEREAVASLIDTADRCGGDDEETARIFLRLLSLPDEDVQRIAAFIMAETLAAGSMAVEVVGVHMTTDPGTHWCADDAFLDLIRDKATLKVIVAEVAGQGAADGNGDAKSGTLRQIIRDALAGRNGRTKAENWLPGWLTFPLRTYTSGSSRLIDQTARAATLLRRA